MTTIEYDASLPCVRKTTRRKLRQLGMASALAAGMLVAVSAAQARTTQIQILTHGVAFGGYSFPGVGQFEYFTGIATGEVDPNDHLNSVIVDIKLAPLNAHHKVQYQHNFYILKPVDMSKSNHKMMYEPPNRGGKTYQALNNTPTGTNDPAALTDPAALAASFLWPQGYTTAWSGWENNLAALDNPGLTATATFPIVHGPSNATITGPGYEYIVTTGNSYTLAYPAASGAQGAPNAVLTHRVHLDDPAVVVPTSGWSYTDATNTAIKLNPGPFIANDIYEFSYIAKDPTPNGLGFAAVRDFNSFLRNAKQDDFGTPNPLYKNITRIYTEISSQPGRLLNDFVHLGFNEDENHNKVFDGMLQWVAAGHGINMNYRWSQTKRTNRNRQELLYLENLFPFANVPTYDPISRSVDYRNLRCDLTNTCPLKMEFYSANEYWVKEASLFHTDPTGHLDLPDHPKARLYLLSSKQHGGAGNPTSKGACQQFLNPLDSQQVQRALWQDLDAWSTKGTQPPSSETPHLYNGTLVPPLPQIKVGFPSIPGVTYTGLKTTGYRFNYGPNFYQTGIPTINPPVIHPPYEDNPANGPIYPTFVPKTDKDGNDLAGIRLPELTVPLATYTGWALRSGVWANDGCEGSGQYIPFKPTQAARLASGDPRLSVQERYPNYVSYQSKVVAAVSDLVKRRLMLCSDADAYVSARLTAGLAAGVPAPVGTPPSNTVPACVPPGHGHGPGHGDGHDGHGGGHDGHGGHGH